MKKIKKDNRKSKKVTKKPKVRSIKPGRRPKDDGDKILTDAADRVREAQDALERERETGRKLSLDSAQKIQEISDLKAQVERLNIQLTEALDRIDELENPKDVPAEPREPDYIAPEETTGLPVKHDGSESRFRKDTSPRRLMDPFNK